MFALKVAGNIAQLNEHFDLFVFHRYLSVAM